MIPMTPTELNGQVGVMVSADAGDFLVTQKVWDVVEQIMASPTDVRDLKTGLALVQRPCFECGDTPSVAMDPHTSAPLCEVHS